MRCQNAMADTFLLAFPAVVFHLVTCGATQLSVIIQTVFTQCSFPVKNILVCLNLSPFFSFFLGKSKTSIWPAITPILVNCVY